MATPTARATSTKKRHVSLRLTDGFYDALMTRSAAEGRSAHQHVLELLKEDAVRHGVSTNNNGPAALDKPGTMTDVHQEDDSAHER